MMPVMEKKTKQFHHRVRSLRFCSFHRENNLQHSFQHSVAEVYYRRSFLHRIGDTFDCDTVQRKKNFTIHASFNFTSFFLEDRRK